MNLARLLNNPVGTCYQVLTFPFRYAPAYVAYDGNDFKKVQTMKEKGVEMAAFSVEFRAFPD